MKPTTRKPTAVRRREIAQAVLRVIGESGASSLTAATLAREVGLTPGALFRHFASLDEILVATVELAARRIEESFPSEQLAPLERLRELASSRVELLGTDPGLAWLLLSDQVYLTVPEAAVVRLSGLVERSRAFLLKALTEAVASGALRADVDVGVLLILLTGTIHALVGARGVHSSSKPAAKTHDPKSVLDAFFALLSPTDSKTAN